MSKIKNGQIVRHVNNERQGKVIAVSVSGRVVVVWDNGTVALVSPTWLVPA